MRDDSVNNYWLLMLFLIFLIDLLF